MQRPSLLLVRLACALWLALATAARAGEPPAEPIRAGQTDRAVRGGKPGAEPLSKEDAALVRELALLERVELLRNLELFEPIKQAQGRRKKGSP